MEPFEIKIGDRTAVYAHRDGEWVILRMKDGSAETTVSLTAMQALDLAKIVKGCGVTAAMREAV
jgi:hypothetical protein